MTPAEVLRKAADLIEERGWWNGRGDSNSPVYGTHCALTALRDVCPGERLRFAAVGAIEEKVRGLVSEWNDRQPNGEVVIAKLREVAGDLERAS
jgi:hypothetical protein